MACVLAVDEYGVDREPSEGSVWSGTEADDPIVVGADGSTQRVSREWGGLEFRWPGECLSIAFNHTRIHGGTGQDDGL